MGLRTPYEEILQVAFLMTLKRAAPKLLDHRAEQARLSPGYVQSASPTVTTSPGLNKFFFLWVERSTVLQRERC